MEKFTGDYAMFMTDPSGLIVTWNDGAEAIFGYKKDEIIGNSISTLYTPCSTKDNEPANNLQQAKIFSNYRTKGLRVKKDGTLFSADVYYMALFDDENQLTGYAKTTRIIKDGKPADELLNKQFFKKRAQATPEEDIVNDKRFRKLIENSYEGISLLDKDFNVIFRSHSAEHIGGWNTKERVKHSMLELIHDDDRNRVLLQLNEVLQNSGQPRTIAYRSKHIKGHYQWLESIFTNFLNEPDINAIVCNFRDITDEIKSKELLEANEKYFRALVENGNDGIVAFDSNNNPNYLSPGFYRILGYTKDEVIQMDRWSIVHPDDLDNTRLKIIECFNAPGIPVKVTYRMKNKNGEWRWLESTFTNFFNEPAIGGIINNFRDVTEKKESEALIIESESKYRLLFENNPLPIIVWEFKTLKIIDSNEAAQVKYGYTAGEFTKLSTKDIRPSEDWPLLEAATKNEEAYGKRHHQVWRHLKKNGDVMYLDITGSFINFNGKRVVLSISNDVTESRYFTELEKLEKELLEANTYSTKSLHEALDLYLKGIEAINLGMICSVLEKKGDRLYNFSAPGLPLAYRDAIEGIEIGPYAGSCGTAAFFNEKVLVGDIQDDKRWANFKMLAAEHDLMACWSHPIVDAVGNVMATFAIYYRQPKYPSELEEVTISRAVHILQVILESYYRQQALKLSNERFEYVTEATSDIIWDWDLETNGVYYSKNIYKLFGHPAGVNYNNLPFYLEHVHPEDRERVVLYPGEVKYGTMINWAQDYRFKKADGVYAYIRDKGVVIRDENGLGIRMVGAMQDVTLQKLEEHRLKLLESVITHTRDSILITKADPLGGPDTRIIYANEAFTKMTGYLPEEVTGKSPRFLQGPKTGKTELEQINNSLKNWQPCEATVVNYKKNGEEFWINFSFTPVADEKGQYTHWISIARNVTRQKNEELQNALIAEISQVFNKAPRLKECLVGAMEIIDKYGNFSLMEFWLTDAEGNNINLMASFTKSEKLKAYTADSARYTGTVKGEGLLGTAWATKQMQYWHYKKESTVPKRIEEAKKAGLKRVYSLPLLYNGEVMGILLLSLDKDELPNFGFSETFDTFSKVFAAEIKRKQAEDDLNRVFNFAPDIICISGIDRYFKKVNPAMSSLLEYSEQELLTKPLSDFIHPEDLKDSIVAFESQNDTKPTIYFENRYITKTGKIKWLAWTSTHVNEDGLFFNVAKNITEKKELEELLNKATRLTGIGAWEVDQEKGIINWSDITREIHEAEPGFELHIEDAANFYKEGESRETISAIMTDAAQNGTPADVELQIVTAKGNEKWVRIVVDTEFINGKCSRLYGSFQDIDARKKIEMALEASLSEKRTILESIGDAFFTVDKAWIVTYWNKMASKLTHKPTNQMLGNRLWDIFKEAVDSLSYTNYHLVMETKQAVHYEEFYRALDKWFDVSAYPSEIGISVYFKDITDRKKSETRLMELNENLQIQAKELAISNAELEQFAYVASHDLQEPLRMVTSFLTQIERKYNPVLDDRGRQYIHFAVDGAKRMRQIILDLLNFSRVGRTDDDMESVDLNKLINEILALYRKQIEEKRAKIIFSNLPTLLTYKTAIREVLQNLISNGLKYHKPGESPFVNINCSEKEGHWLISVKDNGIGIDDTYFDKIFIIFQRLHTREEFSGTGMGLAITKKIVENLGGKIWVESEEGKGTTFYFTLLKNEKS